MSGGPLAQGAYNQYRPIVLKILEGVYEKTLDSVQTRNNYGSHFLNVHKAVYDINASLAHSYTGQGKASFFSSNKTSEFIPPEGLLFVPIQGDGHCFFRAVSLYLGEDVSDLRTRATDYIRANLNDFQEYFTDQNIERYLDELANTNAWADNMAISALSQALERPIAIVQSNRTELVNAELFPNGEPMFVHYDGVNHYNGLTLTDTDSLSAESIMANIEVNQSFSNYSL